MSLLHVVILAIVQGATEFLPVSSSAHLALAPWLLKWPDQGQVFDIALHVGTLLAVLIYFFRDWLQIVLQAFGFKYRHNRDLARNPGLFWYLVIGSIPVAIAGVLFGKQSEEEWRNPFVIGGMLIGVGLLMGLADRIGRKVRDISHIGLPDAFTIGLAQALAIVPGTSRSGITITAALFRDIDRSAAARFSFLLSTPAIFGAAAKALWDLKKHGGIPHDMVTPFILGVAVSAVTGAIVISWFMRFLRSGSLKVFVYYRIIFGIIVIALAIFYRPPAG